MSQTQCPYCAASDGRCVVAGGGRFLTECRSCGRVTEERLSEVEELFIERAHDAPLCIVTPDFSENESYKAPPIDDDPFESIGFITAFSTWSLEQSPLFTATCTGYSGQLAELERILSDSLYSGGGTMPTSLAGASMSMIDTLRAYFQIVEVSSILGLERESCDHAIQLFRECLSTTYVRNRNTVEALATAALVQAIREGQEPRTLQEISAAANIPQKEIGRHMKLLSDSLKLSQPINSNSISVHMPRFCNLLQLSKSTQDLATHIGEVVINKSFCTRRNPISISAAAIYLSCQLEDKRKTQTEICKATGLTEVTLRKVYKELLENLDDLLPPDYTPAVPLEKAFPVTAVALGRVHVARAAGGGALIEPSLPNTPYNTVVSNNGAGLAGDSSSVVGGSALGASPPAQANLVRAPVSGAASDRGSAAVATYMCPIPSADGGPAIPLFSLPHGTVGGSPVRTEATDRPRRDGAQEIERDPNELEREKERERDRMDADYGAQKNVGMLPAASVSGFRPSFFPIPVDPRLFQEINPVMWPLHLYGGSPMRAAEDGAASARGADRTSREDGAGNAALANSKPGPSPQQQYVSFLPGMPENLNPSLQVKMLPLMQGRPLDVTERQGVFERERDPEEGIPGRDCGENGSHASPLPTTNSAATLQNFAAAAAAAAAASGRQGAPVFPGFPPGLWPFVGAGGSGPYGVFPQFVQSQNGGLPQGLRQGGDNHSVVSEKSLEGLPHGLLASAGAEALARMTGPGVTSQAGGLGGQPNHLIPWPGAPFHPLFLPGPMNVGPGPPGGISSGISSIDVSSGMQNDVCDGGGSADVGGGAGGVDVSTRAGASGGGLNLSQQPAPDQFPMLSIGLNNGQQVAGGHIPVVMPQHSDNVEVSQISAPLANQVSFERQTPHEQH